MVDAAILDFSDGPTKKNNDFSIFEFCSSLLGCPINRSYLSTVYPMIPRLSAFSGLCGIMVERSLVKMQNSEFAILRIIANTGGLNANKKLALWELFLTHGAATWLNSLPL